MKITGIILAGGKGRRMGAEKGLIPFLGKPMIEHVLSSINPICDQIIISANTGDYNYLNYPVVKDEYKNAGPSAGILAGLLNSDNETNIVVPCDMPFISTSFLNCLLSFAGEYDITVPVYDDFIQPLCGIYKKSITKSLIELVECGQKRMRSILDNLNCNYINESSLIEYDLTSILRNFNSKNEIEEYLQNNTS